MYTTSAHTTTAMTVEDVFEAIERIKQLPIEPFKKWMIDNGGDPDRGWVLFLPKSEWGTLYDSLPQYVKLSDKVTAPLLLPVHTTTGTVNDLYPFSG